MYDANNMKRRSSLTAGRTRKNETRYVCVHPRSACLSFNAWRSYSILSILAGMSCHLHDEVDGEVYNEIHDGKHLQDGALLLLASTTSEY